MPQHVTAAESLPVFCSRGRLKTHLFIDAAFRDTLTVVVPEKRLCHSGHVNRFCYLLTYLLTLQTIASFQPLATVNSGRSRLLSVLFSEHVSVLAIVHSPAPGHSYRTTCPYTSVGFDLTLRTVLPVAECAFCLLETPAIVNVIV